MALNRTKRSSDCVNIPEFFSDTHTSKSFIKCNGIFSFSFQKPGQNKGERYSNPSGKGKNYPRKVRKKEQD